MKFIITKNKKFDFFILAIDFIFYSINSIFLKKYHILFFDGYFNDILAGMIILAYSNMLLDCINVRINKIWSVGIFILACGIFWEFIFPFFNRSSISDIIDIFAYLFGGLLYYFINLMYEKHFKEDGNGKFKI